MKHDGLLIAIFLILGLVIPAIVFMRVYSTAFSGMDSSNNRAQNNAPTEPDREEPHDQ